eukprot:SAG31_NODE_34062_length_337_cov_0.647059_1_plen_59_part_01
MPKRLGAVEAVDHPVQTPTAQIFYRDYAPPRKGFASSAPTDGCPSDGNHSDGRPLLLRG